MSPMAVLRLPTEHRTALSLHDFYDASPAAAGGIMATGTFSRPQLSLPSAFFNSAILQSHGLRCDHAHGSHSLSPDLARWYESPAPVAQSSPAAQPVAFQPAGLSTTRSGAGHTTACAAPTPSGPQQRFLAASNAVRASSPALTRRLNSATSCSGPSDIPALNSLAFPHSLPFPLSSSLSPSPSLPLSLSPSLPLSLSPSLPLSLSPSLPLSLSPSLPLSLSPSPSPSLPLPLSLSPSPSLPLSLSPSPSLPLSLSLSPSLPPPLSLPLSQSPYQSPPHLSPSPPPPLSPPLSSFLLAPFSQSLSPLSPCPPSLPHSCRALRALCWSQQALAAVNPAVLHIRAAQWSPRANRFLSACAAAGNAPAAYFLGMITFYSFGNYAEGLKLLAKAALAGHAAAMYALSVVHFNGSGMAQAQRNLPVALALCARAASLGHTPAMRELGYCLHDGYGLPRDAAQAQQLLLEAEALETAEKSRAIGVVVQGGGVNPVAVRGGDRVNGSRLEQVEEDREEQEEEDQETQEEADMMFAREILQSGNLQSALTKDEGRVDVAPAESSQETAAAAAAEVEAGAVSDAEAAPVDPAARLSAPSTDATGVEEVADMQSLDSKEWEPSSPSLAELMELQEAESCRPSDPAHFFLLEWQKLTGLVSNTSTHRIHIPALPSHGAAAASDLSPTAPVAPAAPGTPPSLHACSNPQCGRQETREHEFRCCAACTEAKYCSRACQAADWVGGHRVACTMLGAALAAMTQGARF
ncbi:unnamed protein product [Closterium sp. NIES-65]|nr:unnamed protein product [Closterium sp. NIES-65]